MKIDCGPTRSERLAAAYARRRAKRNRIEDWHLWFAWYPVRIGSRDCRWLEFVARKGKYEEFEGIEYSYVKWVWEYRACV